MKKEDSLCQCGSKLLSAKCCLPFIREEAKPPTPEALMRSRYTAYALQEEAYLLNTWAEKNRPTPPLFEQQEETLKWINLKIIRSSATTDAGIVEFVATYKVNGKAYKLHEVSNFQKVNGKWYYTDGTEAE